MRITKLSVRLAACATALFATGAAIAGPAPTGIWIDHTGRGAVEITKCGNGLCGHVMWVEDAENAEACGMQILGDVKPVSGGKWDGGWIYDPERDSKFDVELTPVGTNKLQVMGYAGLKFLSETMVWKRATSDLKRCDDKGATTAASESAVKDEAKASVDTKDEKASSKGTKVAGLTDDVDTAEPDAVEDDAALDNDGDASANDDVAETEEVSPKKKKSNAKSAALAKLGEILSVRETGGGRECTVRVPYLRTAVTFPCKKK